MEILNLCDTSGIKTPRKWKIPKDVALKNVLRHFGSLRPIKIESQKIDVAQNRRLEK